jgi:dihydrofolate synthase/folylpolyglutamate synthase
MAYDVFARSNTQFGIIEVGLGGRFDATNTLDPALSVITHIHFDHEKTLGNTLGKIAFEKAGIIKRGVPVIVGPLPAPAYDVIARIARKREAPLFTAEDVLSSMHLRQWPVRRKTRWNLPLRGDHQTANLGVALAALLMLPDTGTAVPTGRIRSGVEHVHWPARFQIVPGNPTVVFDVAHNPSGMEVFAETWPTVFGARRAAALFTTRDDKNYRAMWEDLAPCLSSWIGCPLPHSPGIERNEMQAMASRSGIPFEWAATAADGYRRAKKLAGPDGICLVAGSHYLVGEVIPASLVASPVHVAAPVQNLRWQEILESVRMPS